MNPFDNDYSGNYTSHVDSEVKGVALGDVKMVNLAGKGHNDFRMTLRAIQSKRGFKFKTKSDADGNLWVKRIL